MKKVKKVYLCFFCLHIVAFAASRDSLKRLNDVLKPPARNVTMELNINPFRGDLSLNNALNQIKLRLSEVKYPSPCAY